MDSKLRGPAGASCGRGVVGVMKQFWSAGVIGIALVVPDAFDA